MSNGLGIPGISTGIDTQSFIDKIMKYSRMPLDRLKQKQQVLLWKQEAYRTQNTAISQLKDLVFNLKLQNNYSTKVVNSSNSQIVNATANSGAVNGNYSITVQNLATVATNTGTSPISVRSKVSGNSRDLTSSPITIGPGNDQINVTVDGVTQTITLTNGRTYDGTAGNTLADLAADIQSKLVGFPTQVYVKANADNQLVFSAAQKGDTSAYTITLGAVGADPTLTNLGFTDKATTKELVGGILSGSQVVVDASSKRFKISIGNSPAQEVILAENTYNFADFATEVQNKIQALGGDFANVRVSVTNFNQLRITPTGGTPLAIKLQTGSQNDILWKMNFSNGVTSELPRETISTTATLWNQRDKFISSTFFAGKTQNAAFSFSINGQNFNFSNNNTLNDIMNTINSSSTGVTASYDEFNDKITLTTKNTGDNNTMGKEIQLVDTNGFFSQLINISESNEIGGTNALFTINGIQSQRTSNSFTMNNVNFTLNGVTGANPATTVSVSTDTSGVVAKITEFVNKYNEIISGIHGKIEENRATAGNNYTFYEPLTDAQKEELSEEEIKAWEAKAKQGLLHSDSILNGVLSQLRTSLSRNVNVPRTLTGVPLSGIIDLTGSNRFLITVGNEKREITLTETSYDSTQYSLLAGDIQQKLDAAFGNGRVKVALSTSSNSLSFTAQNSSLLVENGTQSNGLNLLGFSSGATVKSAYSNLNQIGISTGSYMEKGKLYLNTDKLKAALQNDPDGVMRLLTFSETISVPSTATSTEIANAKALEKSRQGIFYDLYNVINAQMSKITSQAGSTGTTSTLNQLGRDLISIGEQIDRTEDRISAEEDRLWRTFNQMEVLIGKMNNQASWITNMLGGGSGGY